MAVITEAYLRAHLNEIEDKTYVEQKGDILTPSARQYLSDHGFSLKSEKTSKYKGSESQRNSSSKKVKQDQKLKGDQRLKNDPEGANEIEIDQEKGSKDELKAPAYAYVCYETGAQFIQKPEHMTQIHGNQLVVKNHERIVLRGQIDLFLSKSILQLQGFKKEEKIQVSKDFKEIIHWIKAIQMAEIMETPLQNLTFMGLDEATQKAMSHDPQKYFGTPHLFGIDENTHEVAVALNVLRAESRTLEIAAVNAFYKPREIQRPDLLLALNRLSSCIYLMMLKAVSGQYDEAPKKK